MTYSVETVDDHSLVRLVYSGEMNKQAHEKGREEAAQALFSKGWSRLLVDTTGILRSMSVEDDYGFTIEHTSVHPRGTRIAVLHSPEYYDEMRFVEKVATGRGLDLALFTDEAQAVDWLIEPNIEAG